MSAASLAVGRRLPPILVFVPQSAKRARYLARYAPVAGEWDTAARATWWAFDGVSLGHGAVAWAENKTITLGSPQHATDMHTPPERVGLLLAHDGRFVPEGVARMADVLTCTPEWLMDVLRKGLGAVPGTPHALNSTELPTPHGTFRGFNFRGTPWTPNPRRRT